MSQSFFSNNTVCPLWINRQDADADMGLGQEELGNGLAFRTIVGSSFHVLQQPQSVVEQLPFSRLRILIISAEQQRFWGLSSLQRLPVQAPVAACTIFRDVEPFRIAEIIVSSDTFMQ